MFSTQLLVLESLNVEIVTKATRSRVITRSLLRYPIKKICLLEQPQHTCQSYDVKSTAINILVSNSRLRTMAKSAEFLSETVSSMFVKTGSAGVSHVAEARQLSRPSMPFLDEYKFAEASVSIQSLCTQIVPDDTENDCQKCHPNHSQEQLTDVVASFLSQLSCLDVKCPSEKSVACMTRLAVNRCCALGLSVQEAKQCMDAAKANFKKEASTLFDSSRHDRVANPLAGTQYASATNDNYFEDVSACSPLDLAEILDDIVKKATAKTMADFDYKMLTDSNHSKTELTLKVDSLVLSQSLFYRRNIFQFSAKSLEVRNEQISLLSVTASRYVEDEKSLGDTDAALTVFLHCHSADFTRDDCQEVYFEANCEDCQDVYLVFDPEPCLAVFEAVTKCMEGISTKNNSIDHSKRPAGQMVINGKVASFSIVLADQLLPVMECHLQNIVIKQSLIDHQTATKTSVNADTISVDFVCQSNYPTIISTEGFERSAFTVQMTAQQDPASDPSEVLIGFDGIRMVLLCQILNEMIQYTSSPKHGIGLFLSCTKANEGIVHDAPAPSPPSILKVVMKNSSFILPRDNTSLDMVGLEVEEVSLVRDKVGESWSIDTSTTAKYVATASQDKGKEFVSSSSLDSFFDCMDEHQLQDSTKPLETKQAPQIPRITILFSNAHIFTALNKLQSSTSNNLPEINAHTQRTGRAKHNR